MIRKLVKLGVLVGVGWLTVQAMPSVARYIKIREM
jgi:hypothetical protein